MAARVWSPSVCCWVSLPDSLSALVLLTDRLCVASHAVFGAGPWWSFQFVGPFALANALKFTLVACLCRFRFRVSRWGSLPGSGFCVELYA